jgi:catechol 2,3-dioxygenase-like lactoylglutathione lyase family enzyme
MMAVTSSAAQTKRLQPIAVSPSQLAHLAIRSPNYEAVSEFYVTLLNARVAYTDKVATFIRYDDEHHRLVIVNMPNLPIPESPVAGLAHFAFTYPSLVEVLGTYLRMKQCGTSPCWCINHGFTTSIYYRDPDGNMAETQYDNMNTAAADDFMRSPYFSINPVGVDFDPELLIVRYERGDPLSELIKLGSAPFPPDVMPVQPRRGMNYDFRGEKLPR